MRQRGPERPATRVLLLEDRAADARLVEHVLSEFGGEHGFEVVTCRRLQEALLYLERERPNVILADLSLPDSSGLATFRALQQAAPTVPVVIITGMPGHDTAIQAVDAGAQDYLVKGEIDNTAIGRVLLQAIARQQARQRLADHLREVETNRTQLNNIVDLNLDGILILDHAGQVLFNNRQAETLFGVGRGKLLGAMFGRPIASEAGSLITVFDQNGHYRRARMRLAPTSWEGDSAFLVLLSDVAAADDAFESARYRGLDAIAGVFNREMFFEQTRMALAQARRQGLTPAMLSINIDNFRRINEAMGHHSGDELLRVIGQRIRQQLRAGDVVGRFGSDEFLVLLAPVRRPTDAGLVAHKILRRIAEPIELLSTELTVSGRVGISLFPRDGEPPDKLVGHAQVAAQRAKEAGAGGVVFYTADLTSHSTARFHREQQLRRAIMRGQFHLAYQPIVGIVSGRMRGVEALLRWDPQDGTRPGPDEFIPLLEEIGLIHDVGEWVLRQACDQARAWRDQGLDLKVSVNLSPLQFDSHRLLNALRAALQESGIEGSQLNVEITESALMRNVDASVKTLNALRDMGVSVSIDDFGTGFSSLSYLKRFAIDALKIDRSFVRDVTHDGNDAAITRATIDLAHNLSMLVIAEGVENQDQLAFLREHRCDAYQGYYFSRPLAPDEIAHLAR